jgi:hypothetical protein
LNRFRVKRVDHGRRLGGANSTARQFAEGSGGIRGPFSLDETVPSGVPEIRFGKLDCDLAKPDASSWWRGFILAKRITWSRHCLQRWTAFFVSSLDETVPSGDTFHAKPVAGTSDETDETVPSVDRFHAKPVSIPIFRTSRLSK